MSGSNPGLVNCLSAVFPLGHSFARTSQQRARCGLHGVKRQMVKKGVISRGSLPAAGPTGMRSGGNWPSLGAGAAPNPDEASVPVPVPGAVRVWATREGPGRGVARFFFVKRSRPGNFRRQIYANQDSLRRGLPHTRNPGLVRATVHSGDSKKLETSNYRGGEHLGIFSLFFKLCL